MRSPPVFLLGPTASGKSGAALAVAEALGAGILSMDAMAVYRGMDVATAKPDAAARKRVRHHGLDLCAPTEEFHVRAFLDHARAVLAAPGRILGVVGTPFYLQRLREGLFEGPGADWDLRGRLEARARAEGAAALHAELSRLDPEAARETDPANRRRVLRALEVCLASGRPVSALRREGTLGGMKEGVLIGIRRTLDDLSSRIDRRAEDMFARGLLEETRRLAAAGLSRSASQAIGTKEALGMLAGQYGEAEALELVKLRTRRFARRQRTWFRRFPDVRWVDAAPGEPDASLARRLLEALR